MKKGSKMKICKLIFGAFLVLTSFFSSLIIANEAYAAPATTETTAVSTAESESESPDCYDSLGALGWLVCPSTGKIAEAVDWLYGKIEDILEIKPAEMKDGTPIYEVWKYCRGVTNLVFIVFLLVVIWSQITGMGISNYGLKKSLPKLIVAAVMVNLSFLVCQIAVDVSNIVGESLRGVFAAVAESAVTADGLSAKVTLGNVVEGILTGAATIGGTVIAIEIGAIWMLIPTILGAIVAVVTGLITIAMRQAVVMLLIMVSPLAFVAYILPNTENLFKKWKNLLTQMLVFYPMFSVLFGASNLAGFAIITSAESTFGVLLGIAVQIFPLFFSWKLMKMSGTFLGGINSWMNGMASKPLAANRAWADSRRINQRANFAANSAMPSARLMRYLDYRRSLREVDTSNAKKILEGKTAERVHNRIGGGINIGETQSKQKHTSKYTQNAKAASNYGMIASNAAANTSHLLSNYGSHFDNDAKDKKLNMQAQQAFLDMDRAAKVAEIDNENDYMFLTDKMLSANKRNADGTPVDVEAFNRYIASVGGPDGEQRVIGKILMQASKIESKQRAEYAILHAKYGHNGYNKQAFRSWINGYLVNDDGWAVDENGKRLKGSDGRNLEIVRGDILMRAPERMVLYNKRDEFGLYYDMKDQDGNVVARIHRGKGADGLNHDDAAFIKETLSNSDIPIGDPINDIYGILSGVKAGDIITPQGENEIGLARYSTTIGRAMNNYKGNAAWAGAMFNTGVGNRQIKNSAQYAIWVLDSMKKTLKPGAFNTQNPASVEYLLALMDPDNWGSIFTESGIENAVNINNEPFGGEDWEISEDGKPALDENGNVKYHTVENPNYEQRMNTIKRKLLIPAMKKILPAFDRLRTSNTADNQKPGTADMLYEFLMMEKKKWENNDAIPFDPTLVDQDLPSEAMNLRMRKHDKDGNLIYNKRNQNNHSNNNPYQDTQNFTRAIEEIYEQSSTAEDLVSEVFALLNSKEEYARALEYFDEQCSLYPNATMSEIRSWFDDLSVLVL